MSNHIHSTQYKQALQGNSNKLTGMHAQDLVIERLLQEGVYAASGTITEHKHIDVVCWGCIRVEVKSSKRHDHGWSFNFSSQQGKGIKADLIVLVPFDENENPKSFHVFEANHPVFFTHSGQLKAGVAVYVNPAHRKHRYGPKLSMSIMQAHKDAWHLVELKRQELACKMTEGTFDPDPGRVTEPRLLMQKLL